MFSLFLKHFRNFFKAFLFLNFIQLRCSLFFSINSGNLLRCSRFSKSYELHLEVVEDDSFTTSASDIFKPNLSSSDRFKSCVLKTSRRFLFFQGFPEFLRHFRFSKKHSKSLISSGVARISILEMEWSGNLHKPELQIKWKPEFFQFM